MTDTKCWLKCQLDKGMFSDEIAVTYPPNGAILASVFVPSSAVRGTPGSIGEVLVSVFKRGGDSVAILPTPYRDSVKISEFDLVEK